MVGNWRQMSDRSAQLGRSITSALNRSIGSDAVSLPPDVSVSVYNGFSQSSMMSDAEQLATTLKTLKTPIQVGALAQIVEWPSERLADAILTGQNGGIVEVQQNDDGIAVSPKLQD